VTRDSRIRDKPFGSVDSLCGQVFEHVLLLFNRRVEVSQRAAVRSLVDGTQEMNLPTERRRELQPVSRRGFGPVTPVGWDENGVVHSGVSSYVFDHGVHSAPSTRSRYKTRRSSGPRPFDVESAFIGCLRFPPPH